MSDAELSKELLQFFINKLPSFVNHQVVRSCLHITFSIKTSILA